MPRNTAQQDALCDALRKAYPAPKARLGEPGLLRPWTQRRVARALEAEVTAPRGDAPPARNGSSPGHGRPGQGKNTVQTATAQCAIAVPRERASRVEPQWGKKRPRRLEGGAEKGLALSARGLSTRARHDHLEEWSGVAVSPTRIAPVPDAVRAAGRTWPARPRASGYPLLSFAALCVQSRQEGPVQTKAVSLALGSPVAGDTDLLGLWRSATEGAQCWVSGFTDLPNRGMADCFLAGGDGLQGRPEAMEAGLPRTPGPLWLVQTVRHRLPAVPGHERQRGAAALRALSGAAPVAEAEHAVERCAERGDPQDPTSRPRGLGDGDRLTVFLDSPPAIRRVLSTTKASESWHSTRRKRLKTRGVFPNAASLVKGWYLALQPVAKKWTRSLRDWKAALNPFVLLFGERVPV
jgi:putative transposase